jgi:putative nucleotidyltransferase with HDIG domain
VKRISSPTLRRLRAAAGPWLARDSTARRAAWSTLFVLALAAVFASVALASQVSLHVGEASPTTIKAPHDFVDQPTTAAQRAAAAARVPPVYRIDSGLLQQSLAGFDSAVAALNGARQATGLTPAERQSALAAQLPPDIPVDDQNAVLQVDAETLAAATAAARADLSAALQAGIKPNELTSARDNLAAAIGRLAYSPTVDDFFARLVDDTVAADNLEDTAATAQAQQAASAAVAPVVIVTGQVIVREGDIVTANDITRLRDAGLLRDQSAATLALGALAVSLLLWALCWGFLRLHDREVLLRERALVLFGMIVLVSVALERVLLPLSPYLVPVGAGTILFAVAFGGPAAVFAAALLAAAAAVLTHSASVGLSVLAGGLVAAFSAGALHQRRDLVRAGLYAGVAAAAGVAASALLYGGGSPESQALASDALSAAVSGVLAGVLAVGCLTYIEDIFGILTPVRLLELGNPNQPLLRRLVVEAPGTYHHSLMVGNLAEAAVQALGGNALLVRIGALYHDIGKLKRPYFFIENQLGGSNPHDHLSPNLSALVIISHVKEGVEMARDEHLPQEIIDFIRTHHGTQLVSYFYERARQGAEGGEVSEAGFRYPGPLPTTVEQAALMLADAVEAAVRAARQPSPSEIESIVRRIVRERLDTGQLDRAPVTLRDVDTIAGTFVRMLQGAYHARVEYPEQVVQEFRPARGLKRGTGA